MKLKDCKIGMKVKVLGKTIHRDRTYQGKLFPAHQRGWGYIDHINYSNHYDTVYLKETLIGKSEFGGYSPNDLEPYTEPKETEYRQLKDITPKAIYDDRHVSDTTGDCFMLEYTRFVADYGLGYEDVLSFERLETELNTEPKWADWLIKHGFIKRVVKEVTYARGDRLVNDKNEKAILAEVGFRRMCIIPLNKDCNRWVDPIEVADVDHITAEAFRLMNGIAGTWRKDK